MTLSEKDYDTSSFSLSLHIIFFFLFIKYISLLTFHTYTTTDYF